ncbi:MAG: hypothetical protein Q8O76_11300, partial [Chloroflexota bacterium]|nr:hypothetical protein [Chloroflexota bacterium]
FGSRGSKLAPLVVGSLLGMMYRGTTTSLPLERQLASHELLVAVITGRGYSAARASRVIERASPELKPGMTIEEATPILLRQIAEEG